jgi:hypothetical protein
MKAHRLGTFLAGTCVVFIGISYTHAQSPSVLYTFDNTGNAMPNIENWIKNHAGGTSILDNITPGVLTITETGVGPNAGVTQAWSDGFNRVRESATAASGGLDLTGLDYLEFDLGHSGAGNILTQFYVQAGTGSTYVTLADILVPPGVATYQVPLSALTPDQAVYVRTLGFKGFDHVALGNVTWTLREIRSGGTPLRQRELINHNAGAPEGGLQGAYANFDLTAIQGNNGGQNQTGLSWNPNGSLQWTDLGGQQGAAINWGNGTAWNGNTFNNRTADLSNYTHMTVRISATDPNNGGGTLGLNAFAQTNNFTFQLAGGGDQVIPIDGQFHLRRWNLTGLSHTNVADAVGINLFGHPQDLIINVDFIRFAVPEPASLSLLGIAAFSVLAARRWPRRPLRWDD